jgi:death-on-curing protein
MIQYLPIEQVIHIHDSLVDKFGGLKGIRDRSLLESSVANPMTCVFGQEMYPTIFDKASCYLFSISRNHPFLDGNKRTASMSSIIFLRTNGKIVNYQENEFLEFVVLVAEGKQSREQISSYLRKICQDQGKSTL